MALLVLAVLSTGCAMAQKGWDVTKRPSFQPTNFVASGPLPDSVRRVAMLPMHTSDWNHDNVRAVEAAFARELNQFNLFEVVQISRDEMLAWFETQSVLSSAALPADLLQYLHEQLGVDAVLFTDLTHFSPYQPISVGIRSKLVSASDGRPFWSFDTVFDSARPDVQSAATRYHRDLSHPAYPLEDTSAILQSPSRFAKYVAHATYETMPPRQIK